MAQFPRNPRARPGALWRAPWILKIQIFQQKTAISRGSQYEVQKMRQASKKHERHGVGKLRVCSFQKLPSWVHGARSARAKSRFCPKYPQNRLISTIPTAKLRPPPQPAPGVPATPQVRRLKPLSVPFRASQSMVPLPPWRMRTEEPKKHKNLCFSIIQKCIKIIISPRFPLKIMFWRALSARQYNESQSFEKLTL